MPALRVCVRLDAGPRLYGVEADRQRRLRRVQKAYLEPEFSSPLDGFVAQLRIFQEFVADEVGWRAFLKITQSKVWRVRALARLETHDLVHLAAKDNAAAGQHPDRRMLFHRGSSTPNPRSRTL